MIPRTLFQEQAPSWQNLLNSGFKTVHELLDFLALSDSPLATLTESDPHFKLKIPLGFAQRIEKGNPKDPLLLQILPLSKEYTVVPGYSFDPLFENKQNPVPGLLHKYKSRVLLTVSGACPIHCRYCFRKHFPYETNNPGSQGWEQAIEYIRADPKINEVIFSGGDPLMLPDQPFFKLAHKLSKISHVKRIRIHTRMPIVLPERLTDAFIIALGTFPLPIILVLHCNHANEIDAHVEKVMRSLNVPNVTLLNQSVLLKNVNDDVAVLTALSERLFSIGVLPYYLHQLDPVHGTAHFEVSDKAAKILHTKLQTTLPGFLVPKLVREEAFSKNKVDI